MCTVKRSLKASFCNVIIIIWEFFFYFFLVCLCACCSICVLFACPRHWAEICYNITAILFVPLDSSSPYSSELLRNVNRCESIGSRQHGVTGLAGETAGAQKPEPCLRPLPFFCCTTVSVQKSSAILKGHWLQDQSPPSPPYCHDLSPLCALTHSSMRWYSAGAQEEVVDIYEQRRRTCLVWHTLMHCGCISNLHFFFLTTLSYRHLLRFPNGFCLEY